MSVDLKKEIDLKNLGRKAAHASMKRGINLARDEEKRTRHLTGILTALGIVIALLLVAKFGVIDLIEKRADARAAYETTHEQAILVQNELADYDKVLLEYRAYSRDWMEKDDSGKYVTVSRRKVLDMIEQKLMTKGSVRAITVADDTVKVEMVGMNLSEISKMCADIEESPFVSYASLQTARLNENTDNAAYGPEEAAKTESDGANSEQLNFLIVIRLQPESKEG